MSYQGSVGPGFGGPANARPQAMEYICAGEQSDLVVASEGKQAPLMLKHSARSFELRWSSMEWCRSSPLVARCEREKELLLTAFCARLSTECSAINEIRPREPIRCRECGHRIMYKKRTKRMVSQRVSTLREDAREGGG